MRIQRICIIILDFLFFSQNYIAVLESVLALSQEAEPLHPLHTSRSSSRSYQNVRGSTSAGIKTLETAQILATEIGK